MKTNIQTINIISSKKLAIQQAIDKTPAFPPKNINFTHNNKNGYLLIDMRR